MPLNKEKMREYMRNRRAKDYAASQPKQIGLEKAEDGHYPDREYNEDGSVKSFGQKCEACGGTWSASIAIPCPYCDGVGNRRPTTRIA